MMIFLLGSVIKENYTLTTEIASFRDKILMQVSLELADDRAVKCPAILEILYTDLSF